MDNLIENLIIGGGLTAYICKLLLSNSIVISHPPVPFKLSTHSISDEKFQFNKFLSSKSHSNTSFTSKSKNIIFHDRNILGGHSEIWGGFVRGDLINPLIKEKLLSSGINIRSIIDYGYISNSQIYQFRDNHDKIFNFKNILSPNIYSHVLSFSVEKDVIVVKTFNLEKNQIEFLYAKKVYLACGFVQTLGILNSSINLNNISMSAKEHEYCLRFTKKNTSFQNGCIIQYPITIAFAHYIGLNKKFSFSHNNFLSKYYISQFFTTQTNMINFKIENNNLFTNANNTIFGTSIHYFDLRFNDINVNKFIKNISPNLHIFSSASIENLDPGPISQSLINQVYMALK